MPYIMENLQEYILSDEEAATLEKMGLIYPGEEEECAPGERCTTAFVWGDLGLEGDVVFDLFDAILMRRKVA